MKTTLWMGLLLCTLLAQANTADSLLQAGPGRKPGAFVQALADLPYDLFVADLARADRLVSMADSAWTEKRTPALEVKLRSLQALVSQYSGRYEAAVAFQQQAYALYAQLADSMNMARTLAGMGYIIKRRDLKQGISWMEEGKAMMLAMGRDEHLAEVVNNLGVLYEMQGDYDKAMEHFQWSLRLVKKYNDSVGMPYTLEHISGIYYHRANYQEALRLLEEAYRWRLSRADSNGLGINLANQLEVYDAAGNYLKVTVLAERLVSLAKGVGNPDLVRHALKMGAQAYAGLGDYKQAWDWESRHRVMHDSLFNERNNARIQDLEKKYAAAKKEEENQRLREQTALQQLDLLQLRQSRVYWLAAALLLVLVLSLAYAYLYLRQQRRLAAQEAALEKQRFRLVLEGEEKERGRLARELHDGLGQLLAAAQLQLGMASVGGSEAFDKTQALLHQGLAELRSISHDLLPVSLNTKGLTTALYDLFDKLHAPGKLEVEAHVEADFEGFDKLGQVTIYRLIQEVLHNMVKHAEANRIVVDIQTDGPDLLISIGDNGKGFDTRQMADAKGLGWQNLHTRVHLLQGSLEVNSQPGRGTLVFAQLPVPLQSVQV